MVLQQLSPQGRKQQLTLTHVLSGTGTVLSLRLTFHHSDTRILFDIPYYQDVPLCLLGTTSISFSCDLRTDPMWLFPQMYYFSPLTCCLNSPKGPEVPHTHTFSKLSSENLPLSSSCMAPWTPNPVRSLPGSPEPPPGFCSPGR